MKVRAALAVTETLSPNRQLTDALRHPVPTVCSSAQTAWDIATRALPEIPNSSFDRMPSIDRGSRAEDRMPDDPVESVARHVEHPRCLLRSDGEPRPAPSMTLPRVTAALRGLRRRRLRPSQCPPRRSGDLGGARLGWPVIWTGESPSGGRANRFVKGDSGRFRIVFEDRLGHRARAAPRTAYSAAESAQTSR
jgi:hypothetical protein